MPREKLPERRRATNLSIEFQGERYDVTIGYYHSGIVGEVFINRRLGPNSAKVGTLLDGVCRDAAIVLSLGLQFGTPLETYRDAVTRDEDAGPSTLVGYIIDLICSLPPEGPYDDGKPICPPDPEPQPSPPSGGGPKSDLDTATAERVTSGREWSREDLVDNHVAVGRYRGLRDRD